MKQLNSYRRLDSALALHQRCGNLGIHAQRAAETDAEAGSRALRDGIEALFRNWERTNGFQTGAAELLLPAGYSIESETA